MLVFEGNNIILLVVMGNVTKTISEGLHSSIFVEQSGNAFTVLVKAVDHCEFQGISIRESGVLGHSWLIPRGCMKYPPVGHEFHPQIRGQSGPESLPGLQRALGRIPRRAGGTGVLGDLGTSTATQCKARAPQLVCHRLQPVASK